MVWPISENSLVSAFQQANSVIKNIKTQTELINVVQDINRVEFLRYYSYLSRAAATLNTVKTVPGIVAYAQAQFDDPTLDVVTEFTNVVNALESLRTWIVTNFPTGAGDALLYETLNATTGELVDLQFTAAQLATFRTQADALLATIG